MDNNEDFTKTSAYRLKQVISFVGAKSSNIFADSIGADQRSLLALSGNAAALLLRYP